MANTQVPIKASPSQSQATSDTGANQANQAHRLREANKKAKATYKHIMMDYDALKEEVSRYRNYMVVQDSVIIKGMKMREPWKKQMKQIAKDFIDLTALTNTHDISSPNLNLDRLKDNISNLQDLIPTKIASIEEADRKQGLYSDRSAKPCPQKFPNYPEAPSE